MNPDLITYNNFNAQQWLDYNLPGYVIMDTKTCMSSKIYLFQRKIDSLRVVFIQGQEAYNLVLDEAMEALVLKHGKIHIILNAEKYYLLANKYLPQTQTENKALEGRNISVQKVQPTKSMDSKDQLNLPIDRLRPTSFLNAPSYLIPEFLRFGPRIDVKNCRDDIKQYMKALREYEIKLKNETNAAERERIKENIKNNTKYLEEAKQNLPYAEKANIVIDHVSWSESLSHLENIAFNMRHGKAYKFLRQAHLGNELIMNVRLLTVNLKNLHELKKTVGWYEAFSSAGALNTLHPFLACISFTSSIVAMAVCSGEQAMPPLTQNLFLDAINKCIIPLIQEVHDSLAQGQRALADQTDEQTQILLKTIDLCQQDLKQILEQNDKKIHQRLDSKEFNDFVGKAQKRVADYRNGTVLLDAKKYIKGGTELNWLPDYVKFTQSALDNGKRSEANGYNGAEFTYPLKSAIKNPIYTTGMLHHKIFHNEKFPTELAVLDSAAYTFIRLIRRIFTFEDKYNPDEVAGLGKIADTLLEGVKKQIQLFDRLSATLDKLVASHEKLMNRLKEGRKTAQDAKADAHEKAKLWVKHNTDAILADIVGEDMYRYSHLASLPMNLKSFKEEIYSTLNIRGRHLFATNPWFDSATKIDTFVYYNIATLRDLPISIPLDGIDAFDSYTKAGAHLSRRIWMTDDKKFDSTVTTTVESFIPFSLKMSYMFDQCVVNNPPSPPERSLIDCTVKYDLSDKRLKTTFDPESTLQLEDVKGIPKIYGDAGKLRKNMIGGTLLTIKEEKFENALCLPLNEKSPIILLPRTLLAYMKMAICPGLDQIELTGAIIDLRYSFEKSRRGDKYLLSLHSVYGENMSTLIPYKSRLICEVDTVTVESYAKEGKAPNLTEFLFSFIFPNVNDKGFIDGVPDSTTYVKKGEKGFIAPGTTKFQGLLKILEKFPHICFSFDHRRYDDNAYDSIENFLSTGQLDDCARKFFIHSKTQAHPEHYMEVQQAIQRKAKSVEQDKVYKEFEENYTLFVTLAKLVSSDGVESIRRDLRNSARIIPPGEIGWFEQASYYKPPEKKELTDFIDSLKRKQSLASERLDLYARELPKICTHLRVLPGILKSLKALPPAERKVQQKKFKGELKKFTENFEVLNPKKSRADLEEDAKIFKGSSLPPDPKFEDENADGINSLEKFKITLQGLKSHSSRQNIDTEFDEDDSEDIITPENFNSLQSKQKDSKISQEKAEHPPEKEILTNIKEEHHEQSLNDLQSTPDSIPPPARDSFINLGTSCYINATLRIFSRVKELRQLVNEHSYATLNEVLQNPSSENIIKLRTEIFNARGKGVLIGSEKGQHDVQELFDLILDRLNWHPFELRSKFFYQLPESSEPKSHFSRVSEPHHCLSLPLEAGKSLQQLLNNYFAREVLEEPLEVEYENKSYRVPAEKALCIPKFPDILILQLKRFKTLHNKSIDSCGEITEDFELIKDSSSVALPDNGILEVPNESNDLAKYQLFARVNHHGDSIPEGHYTADILDNDKANWVRFDDQKENFTTMRKSEKDAYIIFLRRM